MREDWRLMMYGYGYGHGWMLGGFLMVLFWIVVIAVLAAAFKYLFADRHRMSGKTARDLLDDAYARGDISREAYLQKRDDLRKS